MDHNIGIKMVNYTMNNDLPSIIWCDGSQYWYQNDKKHRDNDLPAVICSNGILEWYIHGFKQKDGEIDACNIKG